MKNYNASQINIILKYDYYETQKNKLFKFIRPT